MGRLGKILLIGTIVVVALLALVAALVPTVLKGPIVDRVTSELNERIDADVSIGDVKVSLLKSFPSLSVDVDGLEVVGREPFAGVKLATIARVHVAVDLASALGAGPIVIEALALEQPSFRILVDQAGKANYDIGPESTPTTSDESSSYSWKVDDFRIADLALAYDDAKADRHVAIEDLDHRSKGDFSDAVVHLETHTEIAKLTVTDGAVPLLKDTRWVADVAVDYEQATGKVTFGDNKVAVNDLALAFEGTVLPKGDDTELDLRFATKDTSFKSLLSLVPSVYRKDFANVSVAGTLGLDGTVKGAASGDDLPGFDLALSVRDGRFQVPQVPTAVEAIAIDAKVHHPQGVADLTVVQVDRFHLAVAGNPVDGRIHLSRPVSDPTVDAVIKGVVDVEQLGKAFALEDAQGGRLELDLAVAGRSSDFEKKNIDAIKAQGTVAVTGFTYTTDAIPLPVTIDRLDVALTPREAKLSELQVSFGESDLQATGTVEDLVPYLLADTTLIARVDLRSRKLDLRPFQGEDDDDAATASDESSLVVIPKNLDFEMNAKLAKVWVDDLELSDVEGKVVVRDGKLDMRHLHMGLLGGEMTMSGSYVAESTEAADVDIDVEMLRLELAKTVTTFETLQKIVPVANGALGRFDSSFQMKTRLRRDLSPDLDLLASKGSIRTIGVALTPDFLGKVAEAVKSGKVDKLDLKNTTLRYSIQNANAEVAPFALKVGTLPATFGGTAGVVNRTLDFALDLKVPTSMLVGGSLGSQLAAAKGEVDLHVKIGGTYDQPKVSLGLGDAGKALAAAAVGAATEAVKDVASDLVAKASAAGDKLIAEAVAVGDKLRATAKAAADKVRDSADDEAKKLVKDAKGNPLKEAAASEAAKKLVKEADKKADKLEKEADDKADALVADAKKKKADLVAKAQAQTK
jgi:hypothetical protein